MTDNPQINYLKNKKSDRFQNDWTRKVEQLQARVKELEGENKLLKEKLKKMSEKRMERIAKNLSKVIDGYQQSEGGEK